MANFVLGVAAAANGKPIQQCVGVHAESIEFLTTTTEKEALLLEASCIKKHRPHYNIVLRDDKQYVLFRLNPKHPFPRLEIVRQARRDGARYFGPFTSALAARETWKLIHRAFALRRCTDKAMKNRVRPCLYHFMGQCPAPCMGTVTPQQYNENVRKVTDLLQGRSAELLRSLRAAMRAASAACVIASSGRSIKNVRRSICASLVGERGPTGFCVKKAMLRRGAHRRGVTP